MSNLLKERTSHDWVGREVSTRRRNLINRNDMRVLEKRPRRMIGYVSDGKVNTTKEGCLTVEMLVQVEVLNKGRCPFQARKGLKISN